MKTTYELLTKVQMTLCWNKSLFYFPWNCSAFNKEDWDLFCLVDQNTVWPKGGTFYPRSKTDWTLPHSWLSYHKISVADVSFFDSNFWTNCPIWMKYPSLKSYYVFFSNIMRLNIFSCDMCILKSVVFHRFHEKYVMWHHSIPFDVT